MQTDIQLRDEPLDFEACTRGVMQPACGGIDIFIGTVRDATKGRRVLRLEFEAYEPMALHEMRKIVEEAASRWPLHAVALHHRTGILFYNNHFFQKRTIIRFYS